MPFNSDAALSDTPQPARPAHGGFDMNAALNDGPAPQPTQRPTPSPAPSSGPPHHWYDGLLEAGRSLQTGASWIMHQPVTHGVLTALGTTERLGSGFATGGFKGSAHGVVDPEGEDKRLTQIENNIVNTINPHLPKWAQGHVDKDGWHKAAADFVIGSGVDLATYIPGLDAFSIANRLGRVLKVGRAAGAAGRAAAGGARRSANALGRHIGSENAGDAVADWVERSRQYIDPNRRELQYKTQEGLDVTRARNARRRVATNQRSSEYSGNLEQLKDQIQHLDASLNQHGYGAEDLRDVRKRINLPLQDRQALLRLNSLTDQTLWRLGSSNARRSMLRRGYKPSAAEQGLPTLGVIDQDFGRHYLPEQTVFSEEQRQAARDQAGYSISAKGVTRSRFDKKKNGALATDPLMDRLQDYFNSASYLEPQRNMERGLLDEFGLRPVQLERTQQRIDATTNQGMDLLLRGTPAQRAANAKKLQRYQDLLGRQQQTAHDNVLKQAKYLNLSAPTAENKVSGVFRSSEDAAKAAARDVRLQGADPSAAFSEHGEFLDPLDNTRQKLTLEQKRAQLRVMQSMTDKASATGREVGRRRERDITNLGRKSDASKGLAKKAAERNYDTGIRATQKLRNSIAENPNLSKKLEVGYGRDHGGIGKTGPGLGDQVSFSALSETSPARIKFNNRVAKITEKYGKKQAPNIDALLAQGSEIGASADANSLLRKANMSKRIAEQAFKQKGLDSRRLRGLYNPIASANSRTIKEIGPRQEKYLERVNKAFQDQAQRSEDRAMRVEIEQARRDFEKEVKSSQRARTNTRASKTSTRNEIQSVPNRKGDKILRQIDPLFNALLRSTTKKKIDIPFKPIDETIEGLKRDRGSVQAPVNQLVKKYRAMIGARSKRLVDYATKVAPRFARNDAISAVKEQLKNDVLQSGSTPYTHTPQGLYDELFGEKLKLENTVLSGPRDILNNIMFSNPAPHMFNVMRQNAIAGGSGVAGAARGLGRSVKAARGDAQTIAEREAARDVGAIPSRGYGDEVGAKAFIPKAFERLQGSLTNIHEGQATDLFKQRLKAGDAPETAARHVRDAFGDPENPSGLVRDASRIGIPFASWAFQTVPRGAKTIAKSAKARKALLQYSRGVEAANANVYEPKYGIDLDPGGFPSRVAKLAFNLPKYVTDSSKSSVVEGLDQLQHYPVELLEQLAPYRELLEMNRQPLTPKQRSERGVKELPLLDRFGELLGGYFKAAETQSQKNNRERYRRYGVR